MNTLLKVNMICEVELSRLDLRYECCRMKHAGQEARLLAAIAQRGRKKKQLALEEE